MNFRQQKIKQKRLDLKKKLKTMQDLAIAKLDAKNKELNELRAQKTTKAANSPKSANQKYKLPPFLSPKKLIGIVILLLVTIFGFQTIKGIGSDIGIKVIGTIGKSLPKDEQGYTNFLILGTGGSNHDGSNLTDTIMLASLNTKKDIVIMTSIPRDTFVKLENIPGQKINSIFANSLSLHDGNKELAYKDLETAVTQITNRKIHKRIRITFETFEDLVDAIGGITINVPETIVDQTYPDKNYGFQTFKINAGLQVIDGATALKYARSRHTTSDFDRSRRQQELIYAIKESAKTNGILTSPSKIKSVYLSLINNIDTNIETREILELASIGAKFNRNNILKTALNDNPVEKGGFLYVPPREIYGGAFVLRPLGEKFTNIHRYLDLHYLYPELMSTNYTLQILNGTQIPGLATETKLILARYGFTTTRYGNADNRELTTTTLYPRNNLIVTEFNKALSQIINFEEADELPIIYQSEPYLSDTDYVLELGTDFVNTLDQIKKQQFKPLFPDPAPETITEESTSNLTETSATEQIKDADEITPSNTTTETEIEKELF